MACAKARTMASSSVEEAEADIWRRRWDLNPRLLSQHTISNRADSAALARLRDCSPVRLAEAVAVEPGAGVPG